MVKRDDYYNKHQEAKGVISFKWNRGFCRINDPIDCNGQSYANNDIVKVAQLLYGVRTRLLGEFRGERFDGHFRKL